MLPVAVVELCGETCEMKRFPLSPQFRSVYIQLGIFLSVEPHLIEDEETF
jgi:hypothetical protein